MFLNIFKNRAINKRVERYLLKAQPIVLKGAIHNVGVVIEEIDSQYIDNIKDELVKYNIKKENIYFLIVSKKKNTSTKNISYISPADFSLKGDFENNKAEKFINRHFDLLISYYPVGKPLLMWATIMSKAKFKVGFESVRKNVSHFVIKLDIKNFKDYFKELFRYIEILKGK